jgi:hypothetical protein
MIGDIDPEALFVALVLAPATYSRNRFHDLYTDQAMRRVRRRATHVRGVLRQLAGIDASARGELLRAAVEDADGGALLRFDVPALGLRRTTRLDELELSVVRFALARDAGAPLAEDDADVRRVETALRRLADFELAGRRDLADDGASAALSLAE